MAVKKKITPISTTVPSEIRIRSDNNLLGFIKEDKGEYHYQYIESLTKKGMVLVVDEVGLRKLLKNNT